MGVRTGGGGTATIDKPAGARGGGRKLRIEQRDTPNRRAGRGGRRPIAIVAHTTDGGFEAAAQWFADPRSGVSSHYLVGLDGRVASFVAEEDTAHHAGRVREPAVAIELGDDPNLTTIGIEFEDGGDPLGVERGDAQYAAGAALLRAIAERWGIALDREHVIGHRELFRAKDCPGNLDLERLLAEAFRPRPGLVCLLPVRNGARDLPGYLDSVRGFADAVVALDDGSTDETRAILEADPLVAVVLSNPPRETYAGWDDAENRSRLLAAAATLDPEWLLFLDADERIPADDGAALREFLSGDALPGVAYGLRLHRMWGERAEPGFRYVYRLFASVPELEIEGERLHFNPVPESIPRQAWMRTTLRIQHLGAASAERVDARARKYAEADPAGEHPSELDPPPAGELVDWRPRKPGEDVLETEPGNLLVCLLPVRNGARDLPGYLDSVRGFADAVVALDDGSTDETRAILEADPLVAVVLSNPPRETYAGWDDAENRSRLLAAAATLDPEWLLFLDTDERIPADDGAALREFLSGDALPGVAYGFRLHRMWGERAEPGFRYVYRLFASVPELEIEGERLHFNPVPESIPRQAWMRTTLRIQHLGAASAERVDARARKYAEADPAGEHPSELDPPPAGELVDWRPRKPGEGVLETEPGNLLVCLLPVRNGARDLPGYLDSVRGFADAVVALDDGSTDETRAILEADPLVAVVLSNPPRETYAGWDDAENRSRLLAAAATLDPEWLLFLDTDERIPADDGAALRRFVAEQAMPGYGYLFRVHRMVDGGYDRDELWVGRLFAYEPGQRLAGGLHLVPLPASIPDERRLRSSFRIQHLGGETEGRRRERHRKYREADPTGDYARLLEGPGEVRPWEPRPVGLPAVLEPGPARRGIEEQLAGELAGPVLSAVVIAHRDAATIADAVASVVGQECPEPFEVIVVTSGGDETAAVVAERFKGVRVVELPGTALPGRARNAGVAVARGDYVSFPGSHVRLRPGSLAARIRAHRRGYPMVTGSLINGTPTRSGWASYFLDHAGALPGRPSAELSGPPAHCSYDREILLRAGGFPEDMRAGEDTVLNNRLHELGYRAYRSQEIELEHRSPCTNPQRLVRHHFARGRGLGRILAAEGAWVGRRIGYVPERVAQTTEKVDAWGGELRATYRRVKPFVALGALAAWLGAVVDPLLRRVR